jgi:hypothetical protein
VTADGVKEVEGLGSPHGFERWKLLKGGTSLTLSWPGLPGNAREHGRRARCLVNATGGCGAPFQLPLFPFLGLGFHFLGLGVHFPGLGFHFPWLGFHSLGLGVVFSSCLFKPCWWLKDLWRRSRLSDMAESSRGGYHLHFITHSRLLALYPRPRPESSDPHDGNINSRESK